MISDDEAATAAPGTKTAALLQAASGDPVRARLRKSPSAFRTISEVADELHIPQHVLRFWETRFPQVKPLKRGGGRRYYRPDDITLLRSISHLLYIQGYTIKGVQRLLREGGGALGDDIPPASEAMLADEGELELRIPPVPEGAADEDMPPDEAEPGPGARMLQTERANEVLALLRATLHELEALARLLDE